MSAFKIYDIQIQIRETFGRANFLNTHLKFIAAFLDTQEAAANLMAGILGVGLALGAFLSSALVQLL